MSKVIDEKVVSLQFDNQQFEKNVSTTMSTLDKLKQKLSFKDSSKGLENVSAAAQKVDMSGLSSGVETVRMKFSALEVMGVTALANITNSAVNAGKRMISALTIDPIKSGFQEYETQINATQTILANTQNKGSTIDDVNKALEELNKYADLTIYNFTEMTRNIGTFTAAGIDLETSVNAIQGIANLAAVSGSTSQQASTAMYQLSQALASGTVKLMDWNSVVNAGMGGEIFQNALKETSKLLGTGAEAAIEAEGSFRESLRTGWLTSEVLTETLKKFTTTGANEYVAEYTGLSVEAVQAALDSAEAQYGEAEAIEYASKALAEKSGKNAYEIKQTLQFAKNAEDAATKVKTFTQLWDVMKEAAQSGWAQTWKIIVGDFEEAKNLLTPLADFFTKIISKMSDFRNNILEEALSNNPFTKMSEKLSTIIKPVEKVADAVNNTISTIENLDEIARKVIHGDYKNTDTGRRENLMAEGYNWAVVQNRVNEMLGDSKRHSVEAAEAELQLYKAEHGLVEKGEELTNTQSKTNEFRAETIEQLVEMSDAQLEELGLTKEEIKALRELAKICDAAGISISDFLEDNSLLDGRTLLINSFKNIGEGITEFVTIAKKAWQEIFPPKTIEERAEKLYYLIAAFHKFTAPLKNLINDEGELSDTGEKLLRTFKGIVAIFKIFSTITGGVFKIGLQIVQEVLKALGHLDFSILDVTANIGDAIVAFNDWIEEHNIITKAISKVVPFLVKMGTAIVNLVKQAWNLPIVQEYVGKITNAFLSFKDSVGGTLEYVIEKLGKLDEITLDDITLALENVSESIKDFLKNIDEKYFGEKAGDIIYGLANGIKNGAKTVWDAIVNLATELVSKFKEVLGIHSPSKVFFAIGGFIIAGLIGGLLSGSIELEGAAGDIIEKIREFFGDVDWSKIFAGGISVGLLVIAKKLADTLSNFSSLAAGAGDTLSGVGKVLDGTGKVISKSAKGIGKILTSTAKVVKSFSKVMNSVAFKNNAEGVKTLAVSLLLLVGAIAILTFLDPVEIWNAVGVIVVLSGVLLGLSLAFEKMSKASISIVKNGKDFTATGKGSIKGTLIALGVSLLLLAATVKILGNLDEEEAKRGFLGLAGLIASIATVLVLYGTLVKGKSAQNIDKAGKMLRKLGTSLLIMAIVLRLIGGMSWEGLVKAGIGLAGLVAVIAIFSALAMIPGKNMRKIGDTMLQLSKSLLIMAIVLRLLGGMDWEDMIKAGLGLAGLVAVIALLAVIGMIPGNNLEAMGNNMTKLSTSLLIMAIVLRLIGEMEWEDMIKAGAGLLGLVGVIALLMTIAMIPGKNIDNVSKVLLAISGSILILTIVAKMISGMSWEGMAKAGVGLAGLVGVVALLVLVVQKASKDSPKIIGTLLGLSIAIAIIAAVAIVLSLISIGGLAKGIIAVGMLAAIVSMMVYVTSRARNVKDSIIALSVAIGVMAAAIALLSFIDPSRLAGATIAIGSLMAIFALMEYTSEKAKGSVKTIITMVGVIAVLAGVIALLSLLDVKSVLEISASLSMLMLTMSVVMALLSVINVSIGDALQGALALTLLAIPMLAFVGVLAVMQNIQNATVNATLLSKLMTTMTVLLIPLSIIGGLIGLTGGIILLGIVALLAMAVPMIAFVGILALMQNIQNATSNAMLLIAMMTVMTDLLIKLSIVGPLALIGVAAMAGLTALMVAIGTMSVAVGALMEKFPSLEGFLDSGIPVLVKLAGGIGQIVSAFAEGLVSRLPNIGTMLSQFMINATPFIDLSKLVDDKVRTGVGILAASILMLVAADVIEGIASFLTGGTSFASLGTELSNFMINALPFIIMSKMIDPASVEACKTLAEMILVLSAAEFISGISDLAGAIIGNSGFEGLGEKLKAFGSAVCDFSKSITGENAIDAAAVEAAAKAGMLVVELQKSLPRTGGWIQELAGEKDLLSFSASLKAFGACIHAFSMSVSGDNAIDSDAIEKAVEAGNLMSELQNSLPKTGGWIQEVAGEQDLVAFGLSCSAFGKAISLFSKSVSGENEIDEDAVEKAQKAGELMSELQDTLPKTDGWWQAVAGQQDIGEFGGKIKAFGQALVDFSTTVGENIDDTAVQAAVNTGTMMAELQKAIPTDKWFDGKVSLDDFGKKIKKFGECLVDYSETVSGISDMSVVESSVKQAKVLVGIAKSVSGMDSDKIDNFKNVKKIGEGIKGYADKVKDIDATTVASSVNSANKLKYLISGLSGLDTSGISKFKVASIGSSIKEYNNKVAGLNTGLVSSSITCVRKLVSLINSMSNINSGGVTSFTNAVKELSSVELSGITKAFDGASTKMISAGVNIVNSIVKGFKSKQGSLSTTALSMITTAISNINRYSIRFIGVGSNIITKFASGIKSNKTKVSEAMLTCMSSAVSSVMTYRIHFYSAGLYVGGGFSSGIRDKIPSVESAAADIGKAASSALRKYLIINSPSKVFRKIGYSVPEGFAMGIDRLSYMAANSASNMGDVAVSEIGNSIALIADAVNTDIDSQPTIRPVLDLSDVESGASLIGGLFNTPSIGVRSNLSAINSMMSNKNQNGVNEDVVSAINKLRSDLGNIKGNTYNVNGITYDDGSNVANAVEALVRASVKGRRM